MSPRLDRNVIDKTGIPGVISSFRLPAFHRSAIADLPEASSPLDREDVILFYKDAEVEKMGLKLVPTKGPGEFLVIDHVERPSAN